MELSETRLSEETYSYPFSAIVGQEEMKLALVLNAIEPRIGGVLVRGEKGTAKSTAVRALRRLLPEIKAVAGCPYSCDPDDKARLCPACAEMISSGRHPRTEGRRVPLVNLPLNVTEEMVTGGLDMEAALRKGRRRFQPGLLARANRGILYIDEVNLLDDHIVDIILDAASGGINITEREGISRHHPSRFILTGTMNPEEGDLRPQLLDRFGLCVEVTGERDIERRVALMEMRELHDRNPAGFLSLHMRKDMEISARIIRARRAIAEVMFPEYLSGLVSELCLQNNVAGHRADIVIRYAARALAAFECRREVTARDISTVADMALVHRRRDALPPPRANGNQERQGDDNDDTKDNSTGEEDNSGNRPESSSNPAQNDEPDNMAEEFPAPMRGTEKPGDAEEERGASEEVFEPAGTFRVRGFRQEKDRILRRGSGRRSRTRTAQKTGRYVKSIPGGRYPDIALDATIRAAAPYQRQRKKQDGMALSIRRDDIRRKVREKRIGNFLLFLVDASGSMGVRARMAATKGAILSLLMDAYQKRDRVAMVTFRRKGAVVSLPPTSSVELAARYLREMPVGGRTPLADGLVKGFRLLRAHLLKEPSARPVAIIVTDGRANVSTGSGIAPHDEALVIAERMAHEERIKFVVVDTEEPGIMKFGFAAGLAAALGAEYFRTEDLRAGDLVDIVRRRL
ncbi:MAG: putative cobaltochelatase [Deferribacteres bacterium]|nr:putative cobaltochelatase [Deferribacteres bacterium]